MLTSKAKHILILSSLRSCIAVVFIQTFFFFFLNQTFPSILKVKPFVVVVVVVCLFLFKDLLEFVGNGHKLTFREKV